MIPNRITPYIRAHRITFEQMRTIVDQDCLKDADPASALLLPPPPPIYANKKSDRRMNACQPHRTMDGYGVNNNFHHQGVSEEI